MLKYFREDIVFQEVPNEISISFSICGCPRKCKNCSWKNTINLGEKHILTDNKFKSTLKKYSGLATCVLFLGGEWEEEDLINKLILAKKSGYKTCLYTGCDLNQVSLSIKENLDFIKVGQYVESLGGLSSPTTNQRFIDLVSGKILNNYFVRKEAF